jgi:hypothetical protein
VAAIGADSARTPSARASGARSSSPLHGSDLIGVLFETERAHYRIGMGGGEAGGVSFQQFEFKHPHVKGFNAQQIV